MNPKTKVFYNGEQIRTKSGKFSSFKSKVRTAWYYTKVATAVLTINAIVVGIAVASLSTTTVTASTEVVQAPVVSPVLDRIADCESGNGTKGSATQYKNGQVVMNANTNGTIDIGKYQVNLTYWGKQATALGFDLTKEADNKAMAEWIYANKGTGDWSSSQKCWSH